MNLPVLEAFGAIEPILVAQGFESDAIVVVGGNGGENGLGQHAVATRPAPPVHRLRPLNDGTDATEARCSDVSAVDKVSGYRRVLLLDDTDVLEALRRRLGLGSIEAIVILNSDEDASSSMMLFDLGYLRCGVASILGMTAATYLRSDLVRHPGRMTGVTHGVVAMSRLGTNGRFANQLFQYAFLKLYALRHDLVVATSSWDGQGLFGLHDAGTDGAHGLSPLSFYAFDDDDRALWSREKPLVDINVEGYFQELAACLAPHRAFFRSLFSLAPEVNRRIDDWVSELTESGTRPLIAIHVRRGDYPGLYEQGMEWYRPVPLAYYRTWLDGKLKTTPNALVYIATDAPEEVMSYFADLKPYGTEGLPDRFGIPAYLTDFEILRRASHVTVANSSFSRMAAILAPEKQHASIVNFRTERFEDYDAWKDMNFWDRFAPATASRRGMGSSLEAAQHRSLNVKLEAGRYKQIADELRSGYESLAEQANGYTTLFKNKEDYIQTLLSESAAKDAVINALDVQKRQLELHREAMRKLDDDRLRTLSSTRLALATSWNDARSLREQLEQTSQEQAADIAALAEQNAALAGHNAELTDAVEQGLARDYEKGQAILDALSLATPGGVFKRAIFRGVLIGLGVMRRLALLFVPRAAEKLLDDERMIRDRRYRQWAGLMRERAIRVVKMRPHPRQSSDPSEIPPEVPDLADQPSSNSPEAETLLALAGEVPAGVDVTEVSVVVVVPWLVQGGSETILHDVLQVLHHHVDVSIVTTLAADHVTTALFRPLAREIHHLGGTLDDASAMAFLISFCQSRNGRVILSSNASLIYDHARDLKKACPGLKIFDLLHNDLRPGHFSSALAATAYIDQHIVVSQRISEGLQAEGVTPSRIVPIQNGIDIEEIFNPATTSAADGRKFFDIPLTDFVVCYVGRMSVEKRPLAFLDIVDALSEIENLHVLMIGSGPLDEAVETRLRSFNRPFTWRRHLERPDMKYVYAATDVLILPSTIEGMPLVVLEAMAMAVSVAVTNVGNVRQIIDQGVSGFIVEVDEYRDLAGPICALARDPERRAAIGKAAREVIVAQALSRSVMLDRYVALFRSGLGLAN